MDSNTQKQAAAFEEVTAASHTLASKARDLQATTSRFQVIGGSTNQVLTQPKTPNTEKHEPVPEPLTHAKPARAVGAEDLDGWDEF